MRKRICLVALLAVATNCLTAQVRNCGTMDNLASLTHQNPEITARMANIELATNMTAKRIAPENMGTIVIPVVVHVLYHRQEENISDAQILSQIKVLNDDFQRQNADASQTPALFAPLASGANIAFRLAELDPSGRPTNGITRTYTENREYFATNNGAKYSSMGGVNPWPNDSYLNIWVCNVAQGMLGYAQFPGGPAETDGVVICYRFFGTTGTISEPYDLGRTTTHEVGHYLNLRHIWGDGPCGVDDFVEDTPMSDGPNQGCNTYRESCDGVNMVQNFMDYTDDACMNLFTKGQVARMRALFMPGGVRQGLVNSMGLRRQVANNPTIPGPMIEVEATDLTEKSVVFSWTETPQVQSYVAKFRRQGQTNWESRSFDKSYVRINQLSACTDYEFMVETTLPGGQPVQSSAYSFRTLGCGTGGIYVPRETPPSELRADQGINNFVTFNWKPVQGAQSYKLQIKANGSKKIGTFSTNSPTFALNQLTPGRQYYFRVRAQFADGPGVYSSAVSYVHGGGPNARLATGNENAALQGWRNSQGQIQMVCRLNDQEPFSVQVLDGQERVLWESNDVRITPGQTLTLPFTNSLPNLILRVEDDQGFRFEEKI